MRVDQGGQSANALLFYAIRAGQAFMGSRLVNPVVGQSGQIQLFMPAAAQANAYVTRIALWVQTSNTIALQRYDTDLAAGSVNGSNQSLGGASSALKLNQNTKVFPPDGTTIAQLYIPSLQVTQLVKDFFLRINPGKGYLIASTATNDMIAAYIEWVEFPL